MKNFKKVWFSLLMMLVVSNLVLIENSLAQKKQITQAPTVGIRAENPNYGEGSTGSSLSMDANLLSNQYLSTGTTTIKKVSSTEVAISGTTKAFESVDTIAVDLYLQRWNASTGQWVDVLHVGENKNYNSTIVYESANINIVSGYYYRTKGHHWINEGGTIEQDDSYTSYIYAN